MNLKQLLCLAGTLCIGGSYQTTHAMEKINQYPWLSNSAAVLSMAYTGTKSSVYRAYSALEPRSLENARRTFSDAIAKISTQESIDPNQTWRITPKRQQLPTDQYSEYKQRHPKVTQVYRNWKNDALKLGLCSALRYGLLTFKDKSPESFAQVEQTAVSALWNFGIDPVQEFILDNPSVAKIVGPYGATIAKTALGAFIIGRAASNCEAINWSKQYNKGKAKFLKLCSTMPFGKKGLYIAGTGAIMYGLCRYNETSLKSAIEHAIQPKILIGGAGVAISSLLLQLAFSGSDGIRNAIFGQGETNQPGIKIINPGEDVPALTRGTYAGAMPKQFETIKDMCLNPIRYEDSLKWNDPNITAKCYLLVGPPGTGKTLLAQQLAQEIDSNFLYANPTEFNSGTVGTGVKLIGSLFDRANEIAKSGKRCVIFIDEFDSVGTRGAAASNSNGVKEEINNIINQLLIKIASVDPRVIFLAATNKPESIDSALLRNGRVSEKIYFNLPDENERYELLTHYLREKMNTTDVKVCELINDDLLKQFVKDIEPVTKGYFMVFVNNAAELASGRGSNEIEVIDLVNARNITTVDA